MNRITAQLVLLLSLALSGCAAESAPPAEEVSIGNGARDRNAFWPGLDVGGAVGHTAGDRAEMISFSKPTNEHAGPSPDPWGPSPDPWRQVSGDPVLTPNDGSGSSDSSGGGDDKP